MLRHNVFEISFAGALKQPFAPAFDVGNIAESAIGRIRDKAQKTARMAGQSSYYASMLPNLLMRLSRPLCLALLSFVSSPLLAAQKEIFIPLVVTDNSGTHIPKLQASDFALEAKDATLTGFEEIAPIPAPAGRVQIFVFFDAVSLRPPVQGQFARGLFSLLAYAAETGDPITMVMNTDTSLMLIHDAGTGSEVLAAAVKRIEGAKEAGRPDADFQAKVSAEVARLQRLNGPLSARGDTWAQLGGLQRFAEIVRGAPGRKIMLWIGGYFELYLRFEELNGAGAAGGQQRPGFQEKTVAYQNVLTALNAAKVSVCPWAAPGRLPPPYGPETEADVDAALEFLARQTGGTVIRSHGLANVLPRVQAVSGPYYMLRLGVKPSGKVHWNKIQLKVKRPDTKVRTAAGFFNVP